MRLVLVSDRHGGFPAWTLELRRARVLKPGFERRHRFLDVWGFGLALLWRSNAVAKPR